MSRRSKAASAQKMLGRFIVSPSTVRGYSGYEWRFYATPHRRSFMKRQLAKFRRHDGKRFVNEALATILEIEAIAQADEQARLDQERYDDYEDYSFDYDDYGCSCCGPEVDERFSDGAWYGDEAEAAYLYREEQRMRASFETLREAYWAGYLDGQIGGFGSRFAS